MTLFQALAKSEELSCFIMHRGSGVEISAESYHDLDIDLGILPKNGWELSDKAMPITFEAEFLGAHSVFGLTEAATSYVFLGEHLTHMPIHTKVRVSMVPL